MKRKRLKRNGRDPVPERHDLMSETLLSITDLRPHMAPVVVNDNTIQNWMSKGVRGVRLESVFVGKTRLTSLEAFHRFVRALTAARELTSPRLGRPTAVPMLKGAGKPRPGTK